MKTELNDKSYSELNHNAPIPVEQINDLYRGYWVYVVNAEFDDRGNLTRGLPVVIADAAYAGSEDGIYKKYHDPKYGEHCEHILWQPDGFISALHFMGKAHG